ncbi:ParB/RepB/Spo0J family partition protein [bacterium]|nr:ParB/RepB/Spo0J family partition protein [bacterium]
MSFELGRGLDSLISKLPESTSTETGITTVKIEFIHPNRLQPRKLFDREKLEELANSIRENGIIQPIIVTKSIDEEGYELVAGERRLEASKLAGFDEIPVIIRSISPKEKLLYAIIENVQREDLNAIEEALAYNQLINDFGMSQAQVAEMMGKDRSTITNTLRMLKLTPPVQKLLLNNDISAGHCRAILQLPDQDQTTFAEKIVKDSLSVRNAEELAKTWQNKTKAKKLTSQRRKDVENVLKEQLNLKVKVEEKNGKGKVLIQYNNEDELNRLLKTLETNK